MPLSMHQASIPVFVRGLTVLSGLLRKGEAHARENGLDPADLIGARLAPDMLPLSGQVQRASDTSKLSGVRLSGVAAPSFPDTETTFPELQERIAKTVAYLDSIPPDALDGSEGRSVELSFGSRKPTFRGDSYLLTFALPNFYFHVTTAHGILRHKGVKVGKADFLSPAD
ncbi:DUF1993 domain-containing protein [Microvirga pudoricolor]|uniref:DUF1993 domain-containing protein n=1 Tax=Microvirga pudoricolor TaxID=2778729 RepID=UPI0019505FF7|nr:DUF1993 domain-containing protein [Microvirga pudoricolor]MBM6593953.1 DUF1993 domain-containing protein [Microvirga pudoricolor]